MVLGDLIAGTFAGFGICAVGEYALLTFCSIISLSFSLPFSPSLYNVTVPSNLRQCCTPNYTTGHPFDTLKVLLQTQPGRYAGVGDAARATIAQYGLGGLYKGVASPLIGMGIFNAVQFAVFANIKGTLTDNGKNSTLNRIAASAGLTGIFVAFVEGPQDLFKCQMQMQMSAPEAKAGEAIVGKRYNGTLDCAQTILRDRGLAGPFQGIGATIARNIVGVTAYFYFYEYARLVMAGEKPVTSLGFLETMLAGGIGGVGYWVLCYPLDIVKTAVQCDSIYPEQRKYKGAIDAFSKLYAEGGVKRFSAGLSPALMRSFPANAVGFAIYESVKSSCEKAGLS